MTIRYNANPSTRFNVPGLPSGYNAPSSPDDLTIPSVGIEDVDKALFNLFDQEIPLTVGGSGTEEKKVPVIFAAGEKWALQKRRRALRDRNNALILPLITVVRTSIEQSSDGDITGRGINQQTGELVIQRRLDKSDRDYQNLINRLLVKHQSNLAVSPGQADAGQLSTLRTSGDLASDPLVQQGGLLVNDRRNNVFETIIIPAPQFFTAHYDVTLWTQYTTHMNQLIEQLISSFLPQGNTWRLLTPKGYRFTATVDGNMYTADTNVDDYSQTERIIKYRFTINVWGYIVASRTPGAPVPVRRYVSTPTISFQTQVDGSPGAAGGANTLTEPFLGADDPTLPLNAGDDAPSRRRDLRETRSTRLYPNVSATNPDDPALAQVQRGRDPSQFKKITGYDASGKLVTKLVRVKHVNAAAGETVLAADASLGGLTIVITDD